MSWRSTLVSVLFLAVLITLFLLKTFSLLYVYSGCDTYSLATPGLLNACIAGCDKFASNELRVSRSSTIIFYLFGLLENCLVQSESYCAYKKLVDVCSVIAYLDVSSYTCATGCDEFAGNELCVPRTSTSVFLVTLST